jgi:hypothetical protein
LSTKNLVNVEINGDLSLERQEEQENYARASNLHAQDRVILHSLEKKYGFQFLPYDQGQQQQQEQQESVHHSKPQQHQQLQIRDEPPVTCSSPSSPDSIPTHDLNPVRAVKSITSSPPSVASRTLIPPPSSESVAPKEKSTVDLEQELRQVESRLLYWKKKQKEWRKFRQDLERSRVELSASLSYDPHSQFALLEMERAYAQQMKEKKASRHEILSLADRLQELNASLGATKV